MPHLTIEYTRNLEDGFALAETLREVNETLVASGQIRNEPDLKSRIVPLDDYVVGTGAGARGFVYCVLRVLPGRDDATKAALTERIGVVMRNRIPRPAGMMVQLSVEIVEMHKPSYVKEVLPA
ncbi:5-carboxymethyl-2-hydroxymuconate Delta-isomerase [Xylophilus sp. GOD-11R]|uniref:5-carboxymethyl-2-hydroxymuconate Delta-isomerase n=1 Tax=Xylophilus sp. GOD-11R TaxID=3089814 RepID=UPI00298C1B32|nr:5-carboxymethyl-2-hydroxymuconate Delta-isomerase [Xylophilus sp. GOD-11R]WPB58135.1 5-carboxymethyl-2-hydroxymuconate Delta-isomerase [Xylophilus sp. GOD-11R]